jgi:hypothetical protein
MTAQPPVTLPAHPRVARSTPGAALDGAVTLDLSLMAAWDPANLFRQNKNIPPAR